MKNKPAGSLAALLLLLLYRKLAELCGSLPAPRLGRRIEVPAQGTLSDRLSRRNVALASGETTRIELPEGNALVLTP